MYLIITVENYIEHHNKKQNFYNNNADLMIISVRDQNDD